MNNSLDEKLKELNIKIENRALLPDLIWLQVVSTIEELYKEYPEVTAARIAEIRAVKDKPPFMWSMGFIEKNKDEFWTDSGMVLELYAPRYEDPEKIKEHMVKVGIDLPLEKVVPYTIAQAFGFSLTMNLGLITGAIKRPSVRKEEFRRYLYNCDLLTRFHDYVSSQNERNRTSNVGPMELFLTAVADKYVGLELEISDMAIREYRRLFKEMTKTGPEQ